MSRLLVLLLLLLLVVVVVVDLGSFNARTENEI